jgi:hypothetical protein
MKWLIPLLIAILLTIMLIWNVPVSTTTEVLPAFVNVTEGIIGVHMTKEEQRELNFGAIFPGAAATKTLNLTCGSSPPAHVRIESEGRIASWITFERNDFVIDEPLQVNVTVSIPEGTEQGRYTGSVTIRYTTSYGASLLHMLGKR